MPLHVLFGLAGFFFGIVLYVYLFTILLKRREKRHLEFALLFLIGGLLLWYLGNFLSLLLRQMDTASLAPLLGSLEGSAYLGLSLLPALLLHTHWAYYRRHYRLGRWEKPVFGFILLLLYVQLIFLPQALASFLRWPAVHPFEKLGPYAAPFLSLFALSYYACCYLQARILQQSRNPVERGVFRILLTLFVLIPIFNGFVFLAGGNRIPGVGDFLTMLALLSSLFPSLVVAYYIYRYDFLEIIVHRSIASALLILATLAAYGAGIRRFGQYLQDELGAPAMLVEGAFLVVIVLFFPPLSRWMENRVSRLFRGEMRKYRELGEALNRSARLLLDVHQLREFIEKKLQSELRASRVKIHLSEAPPAHAPPRGLYPLQTGERTLGYLEIHLSDVEFSGTEEESMRLLSNEIAIALERCQLLESKLQTERELAQKSYMEDLGRMAATVAHNVRNPLSSMKTLMQLLQEAENITPAQEKEITMMIREIDRLSKTVTSLLKFSRREHPASLTEVNLEQLLESLKSLFRGDLQARQLRLQAELQLSSPTLRSNSDFLIDILSNLLSNAIEASSPGDTIRIQVARKDSQVEIIVEDEGPGIPPHIRENLFQPFVTTRAQGTGLGLAIVRQRVDQLGGRLEVFSPATHKGTRFVLNLPSE